MAALDTNILVRYLVQDDAAQLASARRLIRQCVNGGETLYIPVSVSLELEWVLRSNFSFGKDAVVRTLSTLLSAVELSFESEAALEYALALYGKGAADSTRPRRKWMGPACWPRQEPAAQRGKACRQQLGRK
jgi:predicted nucleic-acid-binding protein